MDQKKALEKDSNNSPTISVVMSVYNGEEFVSRSIQSIMNQTFGDFEFIIINDGSSDKTVQIVSDFIKKDQRIKIIDRKKNIGLTRSLNDGIAKAKGSYIARQDADDESLPERLERQIAYFERHPQTVILGTNGFEIMNGVLKTRNYFNDELLKTIVFLKNPFPHTSVMFRKDVFMAIGRYDETYSTSQDFECWMRFAKHGKISMLETPLVKQLKHHQAISQKKKLLQCYNGARARFKHPESGRIGALQATVYQLITAYMPRRIVALKRKWFDEKPDR